MSKDLEEELDEIEFKLASRYERLSNCRELLDSLVEILERSYYSDRKHIGENPERDLPIFAQIYGKLVDYYLNKEFKY